MGQCWAWSQNLSKLHGVGLHLWINNCGQIQKTKQLSCDETVMLKVAYAPHMYSHPPLLDTHTHTRLQPVAYLYSWNPKTKSSPSCWSISLPAQARHFGIVGGVVPLGPVASVAHWLREPESQVEVVPAPGALLLRVRFLLPDESTINSRKDWGVCWFARIARRWTFG